MRRAVPVLLLTALAACGTPSAPGPPPPPPPPTPASIRVIRAPATTDTISGLFTDSLIIEVRGVGGLPAANAEVLFGGTAVTRLAGQGFRSYVIDDSPGKYSDRGYNLVAGTRCEAASHEQAH